PARRAGCDLPPRRADEDEGGSLTVCAGGLLRFARNDTQMSCHCEEQQRRSDLLPNDSRRHFMRSMLFVPADSERKLARGLDSGADALILDLEDSVAAANRPTARRLARDFLTAHSSHRILRYIRVNPLASGLALDDLAATVAGRPDGILLPKCLPEDVRTLDHYLSAFETTAGAPPGAIRIIAIATETPQAVFALGGYGGVSR